MKVERRVKQLIDPVSTPVVRRNLIGFRDSMVGTVAGLAGRIGTNHATPSFIIIGAQKAGTTFLFQELLAHPSVVSPLTKELHYFDDRYSKGTEWYRGHFPRRAEALVVGEASPGYIFHPLAPARIRRDLPDTKIIAVLREPVARAFSHWRHERRLGSEALGSFEAAVAAEPERTNGLLEMLQSKPDMVSYSFRHHSYLARGRYVEQLRRWSSLFSDDQMLVLDSSHLYKDPIQTLQQVHDFLELPEFVPHQTGKNDMAAKDGERLDPSFAEALREHFQPFNAQLESEYGIGGTW